MAKGILIILVVLLFLAGMGLLGYSIFSTTSILPRLSDATENIEDYKSPSQGYHNIRSVEYYREFTNSTNQTDICNGLDLKKVLILKAVFKRERMPDSCDLTVDGKFEERVVPYKPSCSSNCAEEIELMVDIDRKDIFKEHEFKLCCNGICKKFNLPSLC